jgi:hypothetical protein
VGDPVDIRLMAGVMKLKGTITDIARRITDRDNPNGNDPLAYVNPTLNRVRLARRAGPHCDRHQPPARRHPDRRRDDRHHRGAVARGGQGAAVGVPRVVCDDACCCLPMSP